MATKAPAAILSGVTVSFGLMSFPVDVVPAMVSKNSKAAKVPTASNVCPTCAKPSKLKQKLFCEDKNHGPFVAGDAHKAIEVDGVLRKVDAEDIEEAKTPAAVDPKAMNLELFPASQVEAATLPAGALYRLRVPAKGGPRTEQAYALLRAMVTERSEVAFICELMIKGAAKLYRVINHNDVITLTELVRPNELHDFPAPEVECPEALVTHALDLVDALVEDFEPEQWHDASKERLAALRDSLAKEKTEMELAIAEIPETTDHLLALLQQSVDATKAA